MATTEQSFVVGLFQDRAMAEHAVVDEFERAGIRDDEIKVWGGGASADGLLAGLKSLFSEEGTTGDVYDDLVGLGMPQDDAQYYQQEYEAGRSLVAVMNVDTGRLQDARTILASYGGYDATRRPTQIAGDAATIPKTAQGAVVENEEGRRMQLNEEQLQVNVTKQTVHTSEVSIGKRQVQGTQQVSDTVRLEEAHIESRGEVNIEEHDLDAQGH